MEQSKQATRTQRRRAVKPDDRQVDPERSRRALLDAALEEFSTHGYAGARVRDIAERAGVSKDLVGYHFGGKAGLYEAVQQTWLDQQPSVENPDAPIADLVASYLEAALTDPRPVRLLAWRQLTDAASKPPDLTAGQQDLSGISRRQAAGEIAPDIDPASLRLVLLAVTTAPVLLEDQARELFGLDTRSPDFLAKYTDGLRVLIDHLRPSATR